MGITLPIAVRRHLFIRKSFDENSQSHAICKDDELKVLGRIWNKKDDTLQFDFPVLKESLKRKTQNDLTKRTVLQISAQF